MVSFAIHCAIDWFGPMIEVVVDVGERLYQILLKDVQWVSNLATLRAMAMHECCSELGNPPLPLLYRVGIVLLKHLSMSINNIIIIYVAAKYRLYNDESLNLLQHALG